MRHAIVFESEREKLAVVVFVFSLVCLARKGYKFENNLSCKIVITFFEISNKIKSWKRNSKIQVVEWQWRWNSFIRSKKCGVVYVLSRWMKLFRKKVFLTVDQKNSRISFEIMLKIVILFCFTIAFSWNRLLGHN